MNIQQTIEYVIEHNDLSHEQMQNVMQSIMTGEATDAQIAAMMVAMRMKGETVEELAGAASVMRELSTKIPLESQGTIDIVGTGGDGAKIFNVSTASSFVVAAAGGKVAKHGNRSVSSSSGSADVLEAARVNLQLTPEQVARCVEELGVGFLFAPSHHQAMKHAIGARKQLGVRSFFNLLGPMTNPVNTEFRLVGVFDAKFCEAMAKVMSISGVRRAWVVCSEDGLDEISITAPTNVVEIFDGELKTHIVSPQALGKPTMSLSHLVVGDSKESYELIKAAFTASESGEKVDAARQIIAMNAGAALYISEQALSYGDGVAMAEDVIYSGLALEKIKQLAEITQLMK